MADDGEQEQKEGEEEEEGEEDTVDQDAVGVAKMRVSEIKAELDVRGIGYAGIFEKVYFKYRIRTFAAKELCMCAMIQMFRNFLWLPPPVSKEVCMMNPSDA